MSTKHSLELQTSVIPETETVEFMTTDLASNQVSLPLSPSSSVSGSSISPEFLTSNDELSNGVTQKLYVSHFLSTWNSRGFEFGAIVFIANIFPGTLLPVSIYAMVRAASAILLAPAIGRSIDHGHRLQVVRSSILWQRGAIVSSSIIFLYMTVKSENRPFWRTLFLIILSILLACVEKVFSIINTVSMERDWVVVIAAKSESVLCQMNSQMRRIDLCCKLLSPLTVAVLDGISTKTAILVTLGCNSVSILAEYILIARLYDAVPALAGHSTEAVPPSSVKTGYWQVTSIAQNLQMYASQTASLPSMSLSVLHLTVLSFAGQMITYLIAVGFTSRMIGIMRFASTTFELSATWLTTFTIEKIGPIRAGIWFLSLQMFCLGVAVLLFLTIPIPVWAALGLVVGTVCSRAGLWGFDLCAQVIIQEEVEPQNRGAFSATEAALQNLFESCAYASTIIFSQPVDFEYPVLISLCAIYLAGALYAKFVRDRRGHLLHGSKCVSSRRPMYRLLGGALR
ncbi:MAG: hypothetical protein Q9190_005069 [Brigantiaea leucoxantha]